MTANNKKIFKTFSTNLSFCFYCYSLFSSRSPTLFRFWGLRWPQPTGWFLCPLDLSCLWGLEGFCTLVRCLLRVWLPHKLLEQTSKELHDGLSKSFDFSSFFSFVNKIPPTSTLAFAFSTWHGHKGSSPSLLFISHSMILRVFTLAVEAHCLLCPPWSLC